MQIRAHTRSQALAVGRGRSPVSSRLRTPRYYRQQLKSRRIKNSENIFTPAISGFLCYGHQILVPMVPTELNNTKRSAVRTAREPDLATWQAWRTGLKTTAHARDQYFKIVRSAVCLAPCELDFSVDFGVVSLEKMELGMRVKGTSVVEIFSDKLGTCLSTVWLF